MVMSYIGNVNIQGVMAPIGSTLYGKCASFASAQEKIVELDNFDQLINGVTIHIQFSNGNTALNPTLKVGLTQAKPIYLINNTPPNNFWESGAVICFTYDIISDAWIINTTINNTVIMYGVCGTEPNRAEKIVDIIGFTLSTGTTVHIKFLYHNTALSPTLNISNTGAKSIVIYGNTSVGTNGYTTGWQDNAIITLTYDGTNWVRNQSFNELDVPNLMVKTTAEWRATPAYIPPKDAILVYSDYETITINGHTYNVPGIKIADGLAYGIDQPFVGEVTKNQIINHINDTTSHITAEERIFWNNKLNCDINGEALIFNRL